MAVRPVLEREETGEPLPDGEWTPPEQRAVEPQGSSDVLPDRALEPPAADEQSAPATDPLPTGSLTATGEVSPFDA
jgi:hypothetical protein